MHPRPLVPLLTCVALAAAPGCGDSDDDTPRFDGPWGSLSGAVDLYKPTPRGAVGRYLALLQVGSTARALALYEPSVRNEVGLRRLAAALEELGTARARARIRVSVTAESRTRARVLLTLDSGGGPAPGHSFILRRRREGWRIAYDDFTADTLGRWEELRAGGALTERGARAGRVARRAFLKASAPLVRSGRRRP